MTVAARGRGHLLVTASAAGLLTELDTAPYAVTEHASVALAEWLAVRCCPRSRSPTRWWRRWPKAGS